MPFDRRALTLLPLLALLAATPAAGQEVPNLIGTWKGGAYAVHIGANPYRTAPGKAVNFPDEVIAFTYTITEQHGGRFAGEMTGGNFAETVIGMLRPDNSGGIMLDDDGRYDFTLRDENTIEWCYSHSYPTSKVVACWTLTRAH